jgi:hypothetical protein
MSVKNKGIFTPILVLMNPFQTAFIFQIIFDNKKHRHVSLIPAYLRGSSDFV